MSSAKFTKCRYCTKYICVLLTLLIIVLLIGTFFPYPMHASCIVKWKFGEACTPVMQKFRSQILKWSSCNNCGPRGSKCLYVLKEPRTSEGNVVRATHLKPTSKSADRISIVFKEANKTCTATGESVSNEWFIVFDYGANYCNLHNLVVGIGFDDSPKFVELTADAICTQYNMAVCD